jgi:hypothetical protein
VIQACGLFAGCLLLGGGTRGGFLSDPVLQLLSIPVLVFVLPHVIKEYPFTQNRLGWILCAAIVILPASQLIPLPPWIWTNLPGHDLILANLSLLNGNLPWLPISVSPSSTWLAAVSLIPPLTIFLATVLLSNSERFSVVAVLVMFAILSVFLGLVQVGGSSLYFFAVTNPGEAVGFFANKNHLAALLYSALVFLCPWVINLGSEFKAEQNTRAAAKIYLPILVGSAALLMMLGAAEMITRSRAGLALALAGGLASGASAVFDSRGASRKKIAKWSLLAIVAAALLAGKFGLEVMDRVATDPLQDARLPLARTTLGAALHYLPLGSGFGTFPSVYGIFERPSDLMANTYANRAHNEVAEVFLEGGIFGMGLFLALFVWFVHRSAQIWRRRPRASIEKEILLARSATIVISLLLLHSLVDYPLRTGALMAVLGVSCALLIRPKIADTAPSLALAAASDSRRKERPTSRVPRNAPGRSDPVRPAKSVKSLLACESTSRERVDQRDPPLQEIEWPEAWRNK